MNSTDLLNRRNARVIDLDGVQCLVWHRADEAMLHLGVRLRNPWFPAWHWPGPCLEGRLSHSKSDRDKDSRTIEHARNCLPAVESVRQLTKTALSECEGRTRIFSLDGREPDWGMWAEQYVLANALLEANLTPLTARNMTGRIRRAALTYFDGKYEYELTLPNRVQRQLSSVGWLAMDVLSGQTAVTKPRPNKAFS